MASAKNTLLSLATAKERRKSTELAHAGYNFSLNGARVTAGEYLHARDVIGFSSHQGFLEFLLLIAVNYPEKLSEIYSMAKRGLVPNISVAAPDELDEPDEIETEDIA